MHVYINMSQSCRRSLLLDCTRFRRNGEMTDLPVVQSANPNTNKSARGLRSGMPLPSWTITYPGFAPLAKPHAGFSTEQFYKNVLVTRTILPFVVSFCSCRLRVVVGHCSLSVRLYFCYRLSILQPSPRYPSRRAILLIRLRLHDADVA
jgi:hypothetical protein